MSRKYRNIGLHEDFVKTIEIIVEEESAYRSVSDFVHDACRRRIESLMSLYPHLKGKVDPSKIKN